MKEELTREVLEGMKKCNYGCSACCAIGVCKYAWQDVVQSLATALLEEMDKPKHDVWKNAPEWATSARVRWSNPNYPVGKDELYSETYTREIPKTRSRIIAEEIAGALKVMQRYDTEIESIESVVEKYADELEGNK